MSAIMYLVLTRTKNRIKSFLKNPVSIVLMLLMVAGLYFIARTGRNGMPSMGYVPMQQFYVIPFLVFCAYVGFSVYQGLGKGVSLFTMTDVQMLFPSPLRPLGILIYGVFRSLLFSMLTCLYIPFQTSWMGNLFNIPFSTNIALMFLCGLCLLVGQLMAMNLYDWISGRPDRKQLAGRIFFGILILYLFYGLYRILSSGISGIAAVGVLSGDIVMDIFPIGGWVSAIFRNLYEGNLMQALPWMLVLAAFAGWMIRRLSKVGDSYYEDVLESTARTHQAVLAQKEGRMTEVMPENVTLGKTGLAFGKGAGVVFAKHLLEDRRSRRFIFNIRSLVFMAATLVSCFFMREIGFLPMMAMAVYMCMVSLVMTGRWMRELALPWIYRIPAPSWKVYGAVIAQTVIQFLLESILVVGGAGLMAGASWELVLVGIFARFITCVMLSCVTGALDLVIGSIRIRALIIIFMYVFYILVVGGSAYLAFLMVTSGHMIVPSMEISALLWYCLPMVVLLPPVYYLASFSVKQAELNN